MREIKFRGYSKGLHTWVYGDLQTPIKNNNLPFIRQLDKDEWFSVEEASIGQYTRFTDKNGKEIYEGDIVEYETSDEMNTYINKAEVYYDDEFGVWMAHEKREEEIDSDIRLYSMNGKVEVIGNIYEDKQKSNK